LALKLHEESRRSSIYNKRARARATKREHGGEEYVELQVVLGGFSCRGFLFGDFHACFSKHIWVQHQPFLAESFHHLQCSTTSRRQPVIEHASPLSTSGCSVVFLLQEEIFTACGSTLGEKEANTTASNKAHATSQLQEQHKAK
jgi:hypothetical protein